MYRTVEEPSTKLAFRSEQEAEEFLSKNAPFEEDLYLYKRRAGEMSYGATDSERQSGQYLSSAVERQINAHNAWVQYKQGESMRTMAKAIGLLIFMALMIAGTPWIIYDLAG